MPVSYYIAQILRYLHGSYKPDSIYTFSSIGRQADRVVAEVNNSGDMVENTLRMVDRNVSYGRVWASKGKFVRAEPVSSLYQQGRVHHVGAFTRLEDQMCAFTADLDRKAMGYSPDRMDALVWALTELMVSPDERRPLFTSA